MLIGNLPVTLPLAVLAAVVLLGVVVRGLTRGVSRRVTRRVWCPLHDRKLTATLDEAIWSGRRIDVTQCRAFSPPTAVTCGKACVRLTERPRTMAVSRIPLLF